ncbi:hypothetical protein [Nonomuraea jabiensis]|uniref:GntR family transcriptional regulator n=1 Tax=Nonomuraea jabiensis TaxID=882448 RepID=A0A7W9LCV9_9ACTN|nr:hypothetical protein [Nonomuraea jabiensis]MBB5779144.1 hypothetical protein [Nonomuraea jabiensis]
MTSLGAPGAGPGGLHAQLVDALGHRIVYARRIALGRLIALGRRITHARPITLGRRITHARPITQARPITHGGFPVSGGFPVGGLVSPGRVKSEYEMSRTVVREALCSLEVLGMVRGQRHNAGATVQPQESGALVNTQVIARRADVPDASPDRREQVVEAIAAMDAAAAQAAATATAAQSVAATTAAQAVAAVLVRASRVEVLGSAPAWER